MLGFDFVNDAAGFPIGETVIDYHESDSFIFAFWAGREGALSVADVDRLIRARRAGEERVPEIARTFQRERTGSAEQYEHYLRHHIVFSMGEPELAGLREFYRLAHEHGLIEAVPDLRFYES